MQLLASNANISHLLLYLLMPINLWLKHRKGKVTKTHGLRNDHGFLHDSGTHIHHPGLHTLTFNLERYRTRYIGTTFWHVNCRSNINVMISSTLMSIRTGFHIGLLALLNTECTAALWPIDSIGCQQLLDISEIHSSAIFNSVSFSLLF